MSRAQPDPKRGGLCVDVFWLDPKFHARARRAVHEMHESGGAAAIHWDTKTIHEGAKTARGGYDHIDIDRALVDWHSHPNRCQSRDVCALGLPSPSDMANAFVGIVSGSLGHLVYGAEGTYVLQMQPAWARANVPRLQASIPALRAAAKRVHDAFETTYNRYLNDAKRMTYEEYRRIWLRTCSDQRFRVVFFKGEARPYLRATFRCSLRGSAPTAQLIRLLGE